MCVFLCTILAGDDRNDVCMSVFMCRIRAGADGNNMPTCLHLCIQYILVRTDIICLHACIYAYNTWWWRQKYNVCMCVFLCTILTRDDTNDISACLYLCVVYVLVTTEIICQHVCIYVYNTFRWRQTQYVRMSVFMWTLLAGFDRNNMPACLYLCEQYLQVTT